MARIEVLKTYKLFIGGQFPRTESGRYYQILDKKGKALANLCLSSRKDFRNAVVSARAAFSGWSEKKAFNRSQILYRIAEMLECRKVEFIHEMQMMGATKLSAQKEVDLSIDRLVYYAGWCDKFQQIFSSVNPVASSHYNFSVPEAMGLVAIIAPEKFPLLGLITTIAPIIAGGNTCIVLASNTQALCAVTFAELLATSDLPAGVVNILTGSTDELHSHFASHMDVNATVYCGNNTEHLKTIQANCASNVKRFFYWQLDFMKESAQDPYRILDLQEIKTTWHPIENIGVSGAKY